MTHETLKDWYMNAVNESQTQRESAEKDRDYYDGIQYTAAELEEYRKRKQPPVVSNRIKPKIDSLIGLEIQTRTDIKAFPRTPDDENAADAATDSLRYIADNQDFDKTKTEAALNLFVEGTCASICEVEYRNGDFEVVPHLIPWDRFFIDPHSSRLDGKDAKYMGQAIWMDREDAEALFDADEGIFGGIEENAGDTYDDKPKNMFYDRGRDRVKVIEMYFHKGGWKHAVFTGFGYVVEERDSPYQDEFGDPVNPIEMQHAFINRDNKPFGGVRNMISIQDEINKRRSKALHLLNTRQVVATEGAVSNVNKARKELAKPDGWIAKNPGSELEINDTSDLATGQFNLLQEAKSELDAVGANAAVTGKEERNLSGRALQARQQSGVIELMPLLDRLRDWEKRTYRQMWYRVKQFWTEEKWIRVTDDEQNIKFVGLNRPVPNREVLESQGYDLSNVVDPRLDVVANVENNVQDMDMDIILEDVPDIVNIQAEQFELLANMYQANPEAIPFDMIIEASSIRNKTQIIDKLRGTTPEAQEALQAQQAQQAQAQELETLSTLADVEGKQAKARKDLADATQTELETLLAASGLH